MPLVNTSLTTEYFGAARLHDWIVAETDLNRVGSEMAFANCHICTCDKALARVSGVFKVVSIPLSSESVRPACEHGHNQHIDVLLTFDRLQSFSQT